CYDGYILSHTYMPFEIPTQEDVDKFLPPFQPAYALNPSQPANLNTVTLPDIRPDRRGNMAPGYMEIRHNLHTDMRDAIDVLAEIDEKFTDVFGRNTNPYIEKYECEDAEFIAICMGSLSYHLRDVVDILRKEGVPVGVMGLRLYRPFPDQAIRDALLSRKGVIVFEKAISYGNQGALYADIKSALYCTENRPPVHNYILGLGGREIKTDQLVKSLRNSCKQPDTMGDEPQWIGLKM
ncbi:MAG: pyruvate ferredoxin oxidoreductase, partial [Desulfobacteraceae bacterium]|nr:pyruvate ferredoxin oxidoreductase [Desulfobacteraceae bacterium]